MENKGDNKQEKKSTSCFCVIIVILFVLIGITVGIFYPSLQNKLCLCVNDKISEKYSIVAIICLTVLFITSLICLTIVCLKAMEVDCDYE